MREEAAIPFGLCWWLGRSRRRDSGGSDGFDGNRRRGGPRFEPNLPNAFGFVGERETSGLARQAGCLGQDLQFDANGQIEFDVAPHAGISFSRAGESGARMRAGQVTFRAPDSDIPQWLRAALIGTEYETPA